MTSEQTYRLYDYMRSIGLNYESYIQRTFVIQKAQRDGIDLVW